MALVGGDDMIEQFAGTASQPAFSHTALPRTAPGRGRRLHSHVAEPWPALPIRISYCYQRSSTSPPRHKRERLPSWMRDPQGAGKGGEVEVQDSSAIVSYDEEPIEDLQRNRGKGEQIPG